MRSDWIMRGLLPAALLSQSVFSAAQAVPAEPESNANGGPEEMVVTATRREERQDVPISILAYTQEKLDQQGLKSIGDLARPSPGLNFQRNGFSSSGNCNDEGSDMNIRGIDSAAGCDLSLLRARTTAPLPGDEK
jgi:iron complex outermembrane receptor protein